MAAAPAFPDRNKPLLSAVPARVAGRTRALRTSLRERPASCTSVHPPLLPHYTAYLSIRPHLQSLCFQVIVSMDSPQAVGDTTANSISHQLSATHLVRHSRPESPPSSGAVASPVTAAVYSGQNFMQISIAVTADPGHPVLVLRRVQDSYVNVSQMLSILVATGHFNHDQVAGFLRNEVLSSTQYLPPGNGTHLSLFNDLRTHEVEQMRGLWIPYDKAVLMAVKLDLYELVKLLFLVDVHDFAKLHRPSTDVIDADRPKREADDLSASDSPQKRRRAAPRGATVVTRAVAANSNYPYCLAPLSFEEKDIGLISDIKLQFSSIFNSNSTDALTTLAIEEQFRSLFTRCGTHCGNPTAMLDVSLDLLGKTALHYAATLASTNLVAGFIDLQICLPIRGDSHGESPLLAMVQVTNAMEKGNFLEILRDWLWPNVWLFDSQNRSVFHVLVTLASSNYKCAKFYFGKILEWLVSNEDKEKNLFTVCSKVVNAQETQNGNTALHMAGELELSWFIYLLLELRADINLPNNMGVKPIDFDAVRQIADARDKYYANPDSRAASDRLHEILDITEDSHEYLVQLLRTAVDFLNKQAHFPEVGEMEDEEDTENTAADAAIGSEMSSSSLLSNKIFKSIQDLLSTTNTEYEKVIQSKKAEINNLNRELKDATILTANNRYFSKKIAERISSVDTMKLQMANITDKLQKMKKNYPAEEGKDDMFLADAEISTLVKFDADEPFIIKPIYDRQIKGEAVEATPEIMGALPSAGVLAARLEAYTEVNRNLQKELDNLLDYNALTAKFKKVVSFCTGVDINEVDELLDGLLEAVEGQQ